MKEIGHFDPPQTIKFTRVHEPHLLMLQTANEYKKRNTCERTRLYVLPQKKEKMTVLRDETKRKECWKNKQKTGGCWVPYYPTPRGRKMKPKMGFCGLLLEKEMKEKGGRYTKDMKLRFRACVIRFFLTSVRALKNNITI